MSLTAEQPRRRLAERSSALPVNPIEASTGNAASLIAIAQLVYFIFLMMICIGQEPFAPRSQEQLLAMAANNDGSNIVKQGIFIGFALLLTMCEIMRRYERQYRFSYWPMVAMLAWFLISCTWAVEPLVSFRRTMQQVILVYITFLSLALIGPERIYKTLRAALLASLLICWISLPLTPHAVHPPSESDPALIGAWRGFFFHKNIAGAVMALTFAMMGLAFFATRKWYYALFSVMAFAFVIGTKSKTSLALCVVILAVSGLYRLLCDSRPKRAVLLLLASLGLVLFFGLYVAFEPAIERLLADPRSLTGRVSIWLVVFDYLADNPYLGSGFGGFWQVGSASPAHDYVNEPFHMTTAHSHNGYLEILVTTGPIGLMLLLASFVILPARWFLTGATRENAMVMASAFAIWIFVLYHNLLETSFFETDRQVWVIFLSSLAIAHASYKGVKRSRWHRRTRPVEELA